MAKSPLMATHGLHSVSDLLFAPRVAFIWNHTRKCAIWMNPAARAAFALRLEDFSASLPSSLIRRLSHCVEKQTPVLVKVKIPHGRTLDCSVEILKLSGGEDGLIVAELGAEEKRLPAFQVPPPSAKAAKIPKKPACRAPRRSARSAPKRVAIPALSDDEMRAFKAVGRKVLRLCEEKKRASAQPPAATPPSPSRLADGLAPDRAAQALRDVLSAFDLLLFLDGDLNVLKVEGRAAQFGWRKARLIGKPFLGLLAPQDRGALDRILRKPENPSARGPKKPLTLRAGSGNGVACRAAAGRWDQEHMAFFLALISLEEPRKAKGRQPSNRAPGARLAA